MSLFRPKEIIDRFTKLNIPSLKERGFRAVFIDIDNTITVPNTGLLTDEAKKFCEDIKNAGLEPIIFSNNTKKRVEKFVGDYNIEWHYLAMKPLPFAFLKACKKKGYKSSECVAIGDQLVTDILAANLSGCYGVYSKQLQAKDTPLTKINRIFERFIWRHILHEKV